MSLNLNYLAKSITLKEGGKESISIAQTKEVMRLLLTKLASLDENEVLKVVRRYRR